MKIKDLPKHLRPREKLVEKGPENLKDSELLAILLRTGNKKKNAVELAENIISRHTKSNFSTFDYKQLLLIDGIDSSKACTILAAIEFTKRSLELNDSVLPSIESVNDVIYLLAEMTVYKKEHFIVLYLNARNQVIHKETISIGTVDTSIVHPREIFEPAIKTLSVQIILAHNHPSGDITPSHNDIDTTQKIIDAGQILGIDVLDHIIIGRKEYYSFKEHNLF